jgi:hypothetical protein
VNTNTPRVIKMAYDVSADPHDHPAEVPTRPIVATPVTKQEIRIYSHSTLFYWWPAWAFGFAFALLSLAQEDILTADQKHASSSLGLSYISILLILIIFTNVKLRGINSVALLLGIAFITVLFAWFGWWDYIAKIIPHLSVHMDTGFYFVFSTVLWAIWLMFFFIFDRLTYWRVRPGQLTIEHLIGGGAESLDTNALRFQKLSSDLFRATLGWGAGDLQVTGVGQPGSTLYLPNVLLAGRKVQAVERLIAVKPDFTP